MGLSERVAYLKGLAEGMELDPSKKEGKLFSAVIDALEAAVNEIDALREVQDTLSGALDEMSGVLEDVSGDLAEMEEMLFGNEAGYDESSEEGRYQATCPCCKGILYFDEDALEGGTVICPNCGNTLEFPLPDSAEESGAEEETGGQAD